MRMHMPINGRMRPSSAWFVFSLGWTDGLGTSSPLNNNVRNSCAISPSPCWQWVVSDSASHGGTKSCNDPSVGPSIVCRASSQSVDSVCRQKSDLRLLKALQICLGTQGHFRFHKRLCQNAADVRSLYDGGLTLCRVTTCWYSHVYNGIFRTVKISST